MVDDDASVRHSVAKVIEAHGLATKEASSGAEALAILERDGEVPLVISDIYMPEMDGVTFIREALQRFPDMAIVMLTGVAEVGTAVECLKLGALDYISKPVLIEEVRARVDKALEKRELVLQNRFYQQHLESRVRELDRRNKERVRIRIETQLKEKFMDRLIGGTIPREAYDELLRMSSASATIRTTRPKACCGESRSDSVQSRAS